MLPSSRIATGGAHSCFGIVALVALFFCLLVYIQLFFSHLNLSESKPSLLTINSTSATDVTPPPFPLSDLNDSLKMPQLGPAFWERMKPGFHCPSHLLTREGGDDKHNSWSGKWFCNLPQLATRSTCIIYSFGVGDDLSFEAKLLDIAPRCHVYLYDPTVSSVAAPLNKNDPRVHFHPLGLKGKGEEKYRTLKTAMQENGEHRWIDVLKVDVDGFEYESLNRILEDFPGGGGEGLPFGRLNVELHLGPWSQGRNRTDIVNLIQQLEGRGLRLFHVELQKAFGANNCCGELAFVNVMQLEKAVGWSKDWIDKENKNATS